MRTVSHCFIQYGQETFNKGRLMNLGFVEARKRGNFDCFVFHDVDLIPEDDRNMYTCGDNPRHMSPAVDKFNYRYVIITWKNVNGSGYVVDLTVTLYVWRRSHNRKLLGCLTSVAPETTTKSFNELLLYFHWTWQETIPMLCVHDKRTYLS